MDNGDEIPGLNQEWTFLGANIMEWSAGFAAMVICSEVLFKGQVASAVPFLLIICVGTVVGLKSARAMYPDESRGLRNHMMTLCGFAPPGIPAPAELQSTWSGAPAKNLSAMCEYKLLGLDHLFERNEKEE